jgi:hypothetical protein
MGDLDEFVRDILLQPAADHHTRSKRWPWTGIRCRPKLLTLQELLPIKLAADSAQSWLDLGLKPRDHRCSALLFPIRRVSHCVDRMTALA